MWASQQCLQFSAVRTALKIKVLTQTHAGLDMREPVLQDKTLQSTYSSKTRDTLFRKKVHILDKEDRYIFERALKEAI